MTKNIIIPLVLMCLMSFPSWSVTYDDLVERDGLYYKNFTDVPFTGEVTGKKKRGKIVKGIREGTWVTYYDNGQLWDKGEYTNGIREGTWVRYHDNGQLMMKGDYKNGKREGTWVDYNRDGLKYTRWSGVYRNDKKVSD